MAREWSTFEIAPETRRNVLALFWFLAGMLAILSLFGVGGRLGAWLEPKLFTWMGWGTYVIPFVVACVALTRLDPGRFPFSRGRYAGLLLAIFAGLGLLHLPVSLAESLAFVDEGKGGGLAGWTISYWLRQAVGGPATLITLVVLCAAGLVGASNRTPGQFFAWLRKRRVERAQAKLASATLSPAAPGATADEEEEPEPEPNEDEEKAPSLPLFSTRTLDGLAPRASRVPVAESRSSRPRLPPYEPPPLTLLSDATTRPVSTDIKATNAIIQHTLEPFGIQVDMGDVSVGPTVTQYTLKPAEGVKLSKIVALHNDLALALAAHPIRIEAPIPGKGLVGIEVPNKAVSIVRLREILSSEASREARGSFVFALGKDVAGQSLVADLEHMPHFLVAGATGSGKSVFINCFLVSLLYRNGPASLRLLLVDPKRVELQLYNGIPHLLSPVITEAEKTINALRWAVAEMDRRYELLSAASRRDLASYNQARGVREALPRIVIVIDELADLMARHAREVENMVVRLAQIARAVGIHLVLATQRPSVDVITGLLKANITSRIAFKVASAVDARTILDTAGAEKLLGSGDMLFRSAEHTRPRRIQGSYVSEEEVKRVVAFLVRTGETTYDETVTESLESPDESAWENEETVDDALFNEAKRVVTEARRASTSLLQRRLRIGYARAARIMDLLEEKRLIGPPDGARPREVLAPDETDEWKRGAGATPISGEGQRTNISESPDDSDSGT